MHLGCEDHTHRVATDESGDVRRDEELPSGRQRHADGRGVGPYAVPLCSDIRSLGQRAARQPQQQVAHRRVTDRDHFMDAVSCRLRRGQQLVDDLAQTFRDGLPQNLGTVRTGCGELDPADDVVAISGLRIGFPGGGEGAAGRQVQQLANDGGRADIYADAEQGVGRVAGLDSDDAIRGEDGRDVELGLAQNDRQASADIERRLGLDTFVAKSVGQAIHVGSLVRHGRGGQREVQFANCGCEFDPSAGALFEDLLLAASAFGWDNDDRITGDAALAGQSQSSVQFLGR